MLCYLLTVLSQLNILRLATTVHWDSVQTACWTSFYNNNNIYNIINLLLLGLYLGLETRAPTVPIFPIYSYIFFHSYIFLYYYKFLYFPIFLKNYQFYAFYVLKISRLISCESCFISQISRAQRNYHFVKQQNQNHFLISVTSIMFIKPSLPDDDLNNFRPISNLNFISKILEKVVASRIQSHLLSNSLSSSFQSAYCMFHSTETTLLNIHNNLILAMDRGEVTSLILLDLSAAFDTVDHSILLHCLQHWFGLHGTSLDWFSSYLTSRSQAVSIQNSTSSFSNLSCGVPQGSVLGPLLFTLYTTPLGSVISKNSIKYHLYADDTQLYISFTPSNSTSSLEILSNTFSDILSWMNSNKLLLNPFKTEFLLIGTKQQRLKFSQLTTLSLGNDIIPVSSSARNLGFIFDSDMSFTDQINFLSKSCHFHIRDIRRIRHLLPLFLQLQRLPIHSSPANLIIAIHSTMAFRKLTWTKYSAYKILWLVLLQIHQNLNTSHQYSKTYIGFQSNNASITNCVFLHIKHFKFSNLPILTIVSLFLLTLSTRSSDSSVLSIPYVRTSLGKRAFSVVAPRLWNSLPPDTRNSLSLSTFRSKLKTHLSS